MPYKGGTNGGGEGGGYSPLSNGMYQGYSHGSTSAGVRAVTDKSISYNSTVSEQILNISTETDTATTREAIPRAVEIENVGGTPLFILSGYKSYSNETDIADSSATRYLHTMIMPGEVFSPPVRSVISTNARGLSIDLSTCDSAAR